MKSEEWLWKKKRTKVEMAIREKRKKKNPHLAPVWLDLYCLAGIFQGIVIIALLGIGGRPVAEEDVVGRV